MIRLIVGAVLSAIVLFFWGFVFWALSGIMVWFMHPLPNDEEVVQALQKSDPASGTYLSPVPAAAAVNGSDKER